MKKFILGLGISLLAILGQMVPVGASTQDFTITDFTADYYLDIDENKLSTLKTIEKITAKFPDFNQNHGIERYIPNTYDNHPTYLEIESIADENGNSVDYVYEKDGNFTYLRIGNKNQYVHGVKTYIIKYSQKNVIKFFENTNDDEFYWDINGNDWKQNFNSVTARLHLSENVINFQNSKMSCYYGAFKSETKCSIYQNENIITANVLGLKPSEGMTIAVGFLPHSFVEYIKANNEHQQKNMSIAMMIVSLLSVVLIVIFKITKGRSEPGRPTIIAEYLPPKNVDIVLSAMVTEKKSYWTAATYIDLAIRRKIRIIEIEKRFSKKPDYKLELINTDNISKVDSDVLSALFDKSLTIGSTHLLKTGSSNYKLASALSKIALESKNNAISEGYFKKIKLFYLYIIIFILFLIQLILMSTTVVDDYTGNYFVLAIFVIFLSTFIMFLLVVSTRPLLKKGSELRDYLKGLELYIKTAEEDRLRMLQSPEGAEKINLKTDSSENMIKLYESVLPYAILFGRSKEWSKVLGKYYEQNDLNPSWYLGNSVFNAAYFGTVMSTFSNRATLSSSYSSSTGGSGGGGFSGGGGGGGGGGGW